MENSYELFVGIDISKGKADAALIRVDRDRNIKPKFLRKRIQFTFCKTDVNQFLETVRTYKDSNCTKVTFAMEVTGIYMDNLFAFLSDTVSEDEEVKLMNPTFVKKWCDTQNLGKSDKLDAQSIATILATADHVLYVHKTPSSIQKGHTDLKEAVHRLHQRKKAFTPEMNRLIGKCDKYFPELQLVFQPKSAAFLALISVYPTTYDIIHASKAEVFDIVFKASRNRTSMDKVDLLFALCEDSLCSADVSVTAKRLIQDNVAEVIRLKELIRTLEKEVIALASCFKEFELLKSMPGCGNITAAVILAETVDITSFHSADRYVSYTGLSPRNQQSGSSVDKFGSISKRGSQLLRHALFMIAEFARRHNPVLKALFTRVKNGNKKRHKLAVTAVANKVTRYVYSILKTKRSFVILHEHLEMLSEETLHTFFTNILTDIPKNTRRQTFTYTDVNGELIDFVYIKTEV